MTSDKFPKKLYEAVAAVIVCGDWLYMIKRNYELPAFPGYHAFVGGKVDKTDSSGPLEIPLLHDFKAQHMRALCRELKEEIDFDLEKAILNHDVTKVFELGLAITPDFNPIRFNTYFFRIDLKTKMKFSPHANEILSGEWKRVNDLYADYLKGKILLVPPLVTILERLSDNPDINFIKDLDFVYDVKNEVPCIESISGIFQAMPLSNTLPPAQRTNCFIIGDHPHERIVIDPSPRNLEEKNKLINVLKKFPFSAIFLTHHHPDHFEYSNDLALEFKVPIWISHDSFDRISLMYPGYFDQIQTKLIDDGEVLTQWKGEDVLTMSVPGHDEGQMALYPSSKKWCIVGDLIQGMGTVVIGGPEGDMAKYMDSLQRVIELNPEVIIPSHGIAMGSVFRLKETLKHRQLRESQVLEMYLKNKERKQMLAEIYPDLSKDLQQYALSNIDKHIEKLKAENKIN